MRVIVEETSKDNENRRRSVIECEDDNVNLDETLDMILRGLMSYGFSPKDISDTLRRFVAPPPPEDNK